MEVNGGPGGLSVGPGRQAEGYKRGRREDRGRGGRGSHNGPEPRGQEKTQAMTRVLYLGNKNTRSAQSRLTAYDYEN